MVCDKEKLATDEVERYQSIYCGLCRELRKRIGKLCRLGLTYEMTFLILFLSSLYEPKIKIEEFTCKIHPVHKRKSVVSVYTDYAADMTVALAYHRCIHNKKSEQRQPRSRLTHDLGEIYRDVQQRYPRQCRAMEEGTENLKRIMNDSTVSDEAINCFGHIIEELFVYEEDHWSESLRNFGYNLGKFLYLMNAVLKYKKDKKRGSHNVLYALNKTPGEIEDQLSVMIGEAVHQFEKLPVIQDSHLLRNILYIGVWKKFTGEPEYS